MFARDRERDSEMEGFLQLERVIGAEPNLQISRSHAQSCQILAAHVNIQL